MSKNQLRKIMQTLSKGGSLEANEKIKTRSVIPNVGVKIAHKYQK